MNTQITEDHVSFEVAKLLKEKGFNVPLCCIYDIDGLFVDDHAEFSNSTDAPGFECVAPTQQMAMKWIREEKHFYIQIMLDSWACGGHLGYYIVIQDINSDFEEVSPNVNDNDDVFFSTHEAATEAAIKYCLENLI